MVDIANLRGLGRASAMAICIALSPAVGSADVLTDQNHAPFTEAGFSDEVLFGEIAREFRAKPDLLDERALQIMSNADWASLCFPKTDHDEATDLLDLSVHLPKVPDWFISGLAEKIKALSPTLPSPESGNELVLGEMM